MTDELGRPEVGKSIKDSIATAFAVVPEGKRGALLIIATEDGARAHLAARINGTWRVAAGAGWAWDSRTVGAFAAVEAVW
ncbi:MAG TPA: hypothetical protein VNJ04_16955 [Gemmatimonadaceae bacterium]|nr:hypothetical protein [Gemmatimonadaceae bacterium]